MNPGERRVRLRRQVRDRRTADANRVVAELYGLAAPYLEAGRDELAAPYLESAALFEAAYPGT